MTMAQMLNHQMGTNDPVVSRIQPAAGAPKVANIRVTGMANPRTEPIFSVPK